MKSRADEQSDRIILAVGRGRDTGDTQVRNAVPRGRRADNRLIDCTLIDGQAAAGWKEERAYVTSLAEEERP